MLPPAGIAAMIRVCDISGDTICRLLFEPNSEVWQWFARSVLSGLP